MMVYDIMYVYDLMICLLVIVAEKESRASLKCRLYALGVDEIQ